MGYIFPFAEQARVSTVNDETMSWPARSVDLPKHVDVVGVRFSAATPSQAAQTVVDLGQQKESNGVHIHLANAYTTVLASKDSDYKKILNGPRAICFPDGKPIAWITKLRRSGTQLTQTRGPQLFLDVFARGQSIGLRHYLLGSTPETLERLELRLREKYPRADIVGLYSPPFSPPTREELENRNELLRSAKPDVVWVGLGTPKQDMEAARIARELGLVAVAVGAAFDFAAGTVRPAPRWMSAIGLEWLFRLLSEPRRLWRRYLFGNVEFLRLALKDLRHGR